ncbi:helicase [Paenibacillus selenitireducens]|uniref:Helicase n=1 Tax=Paenibacillus selenitireducens TaxID=1324314 RepID=A0A1T2XI36_9BACL|nr:RNA polymerase recycling motor HelD [Paenibacillus selenitireducens]OPA79462.1 helicase [Paenibacillus selenitireducens]
MGTAEQDWQEEQQRVDRVIAEIDHRLSNLQTQVLDTKEEIVDIRKNFWDDVTVNFEDAAESAESHASLKQQAEVLQERERTYRQAEKQLKTLTKLRQSPYFGRIDFTEKGDSSSEPIYLGIASLLHPNGEEYLVYDWRAPVSSLYYDYPPGPAHYETPMGTIQGTMDIKRQFIIRDGVIRSLFDTGVTIGDELLQEVLGKQADSQMKTIVATIQQEQNQIIRNERSRLLIVQGAAGSGKTSAALQRVAYLLYRYRGTLRSEQIILFSPNPMFNSYVSTVLPELGEDNMQQTTFQQYLESKLSRTFRVEDPFEQMEYTLNEEEDPSFDSRLAGIRYKTSVHYMQLIQHYADQLKQRGMKFKAIGFRGRELISAEAIAEQFYALDPSMSIPNRMKLVAEFLLRELTKLAKQEKKKRWVEEAIELLDKEDYIDVYHRLREKEQFTSNSFDDFDRERDLLATMVVQEKFKKLRRRVKLLRFIDVPAMYRQLFTDAEWMDRLDGHTSLPHAEWEQICAQTITAMDQEVLPYEDATPYLYLQELLEGFQVNTSIRHVFIDEAQDYSPFQFAFLKRLFPFAKITALGDLNQTIYAHAADHSGFQPLIDLFEPEHTETIALKRSYRSTRPIVEFTQGMIAGGEQIEPFNRDGAKPTLSYAKSKTDLAEQITAQVTAWQAEGLQNIAIIGKTSAECHEAYETLLAAGDHSLRLINKGTASFEGGTVVIPSYLAKGMEFDAVILYNASANQYRHERERKLFYTACTRAMHKLHLYSLGEVSPFVAQVDTSTYQTI